MRKTICKTAGKTVESAFVSFSLCGAFLPICLLSFILLLTDTSWGISIGLIVDQPGDRVLQEESGLLAEIADRVVRQRLPSGSLTVLYPTQSGKFLDRQGAEQSLDSFETLWLFQGDRIATDTPIFSPAVSSRLNEWLQTYPHRGLLLMGGTAPLSESLGVGRVHTEPVTFGDDRIQSGLVPVNPNATIFADIPIDRRAVWFSCAAFCAFETLFPQSPAFEILAQTPGDRLNPLLVASLENDSNNPEKYADLIIFSWRINPLYYEAPQAYRENFERLLANLLSFAGKIITDEATAPPFELPDFTPLQLAIDDLAENSDNNAIIESFRDSLESLEKESTSVTDKNGADSLAKATESLRKDILFANPSLDFDSIIFIRRKANQLGFPANSNSNSSLPTRGYENEIVAYNFRTNEESVLFRPDNGLFVGDVDLHFNADRLLFSMPDPSSGDRWRVREIPLIFADSPSLLPQAGDSSQLIPLINAGDVDNYDACYLPDGRIIFCSTACFTGVPCIDGTGHVCNLYLKERDGSIRQLTIEQDHDWCPTVMNNGRIMYLRWEYTDLPHAFSRILFQMNPDGTNQSELYGSGSYWPATLYYARPIPDDPTKFIAIVGGHHELERIGDLVLFDPARGRFENEGAIQRIPGRGKPVEPTAIDLPISQTWPKFVHPYPLSDKLFLVSCKRSEQSPWTLCLADIYDNLVTIKEEEAFALLEPIPLKPQLLPPTIPDRINLEDQQADVFITDIYQGRGLKGVPRGTVKSIRVISYQFAFQGMGAEPHSVGLDGPWDPKRIVGTVPVYDDGSAAFKIPAYTPIALQPLDEEGKAIQLMRSWITAMPGETVSCVGCHEPQNETAPTSARTIAAQSVPVSMESTESSNRGFSFLREIQPILDYYCTDCHTAAQTDFQLNEEESLSMQIWNQSKANRPIVPDFRVGPARPLTDSPASINTRALFSPSYYQLRRFVRTPTKESQMDVHLPWEFHADTNRLIQLLQQGHYGVALDHDSWDRLIAWIDLNAPYHGSWGEIRNDQIPETVAHQWERRNQLRQLYANLESSLDDNPTATFNTAVVNPESPEERRNRIYRFESTPITFRESGFREAKTEMVFLNDDQVLEMVSIPGTRFKMSRFEITNSQFRLFDPQHKTGIEYSDFIQFSPGEKGYHLDRDRQPVARVNWFEATEFCQWLSEKTGRNFTLPTFEQLHYSALAGNDSPYWFGDLNTDYSLLENFADATYGRINDFSWKDRGTIMPRWRPCDSDRDDGSRVSALVGRYQPNRWGLHDTLGNVAEWTSSEATAGTGKKIVFGGSWLTPVHRATAESFRILSPWFRPVDTGFRIAESVD